MATKYNQQFKNDVVQFYIDHPEMSKVRIAKDFGISEASLDNWLKVATGFISPNKNFVGREASLSGDAKATPPATGIISIEEHRRLQKRIIEIEQENYILKRATAYFAKDALPKGNTLS